MQDPEASPETARSPDGPSRAAAPPRRPPIAFLDRFGTAWRVTERDARRDPGCQADSCLIFSNENAVRRVWNYPLTWQQLSDAEFDALSNMRPTWRLPRPGTA